MGYEQESHSNQELLLVRVPIHQAHFIAKKECHNVWWLIGHWWTPQDKRLNWLTAEYIVQLFMHLVNGSVGRVHLCIRTMTFMKVERTQRSQRSKETGQAIFSPITEASRIHPCPQLTFGFLWYKMLSLYLYIFYSVRHSKVTNDKISDFEIKLFDGDQIELDNWMQEQIEDWKWKQCQSLHFLHSCHFLTDYWWNVSLYVKVETNKYNTV